MYPRGVENSQNERKELIEKIIASLEKANLPLLMPGTQVQRARQKDALIFARTRVLPSIEQSARPFIFVLGGSSGVGKSTIINTLAGNAVSYVSPLRPATRVPICLAHPRSLGSLAGNALLEIATLEISQSIPQGIVIVDAPDLDSLDIVNQNMARQLQAAADMWIFVTTENRYGDARAWHTFTHLVDEGKNVAVILNRVRPEDRLTVRSDFQKRLAGLSTSIPFLLIEEEGSNPSLLSENYSESLRAWLHTIQPRKGVDSSPTQKDADFDQSAFNKLADVLEDFAFACLAQEKMLTSMRTCVAENVEKAQQAARTWIQEGECVSGAPTTLWLNYASTGRPLADIVRGEHTRFFVERAKIRHDNALTRICETALSALEVRWTYEREELITRIENEWEETACDMRSSLAAAHQTQEEREVETALSSLKSEAKAQAELAHAHLSRHHPSWAREIGVAGLASMLILSACSLHGAMQISQRLGLNEYEEKIRSMITVYSDTLFSATGKTYERSLDSLTLTHSSQLLSLARRAREISGISENIKKHKSEK